MSYLRYTIINNRNTFRYCIDYIYYSRYFDLIVQIMILHFYNSNEVASKNKTCWKYIAIIFILATATLGGYLVYEHLHTEEQRKTTIDNTVTTPSESTTILTNSPTTVILKETPCMTPTCIIAGLILLDTNYSILRLLLHTYL